MTLGASPHMAPGGMLLMQYVDATMGERHRFEMHVAHFDPSTLAYINGGAKVPAEATVAETYAALGALWAAYYPATWVLQLLALYYNDGGSLSVAPVQPTTAPISGTNGAASVAGPSVRRFFLCRSLANKERRIRLAQMPGTVIGASADLSASGGGFDARDVALLAYLSGAASGAVCPDGFAFRDHATVVLSDDRPLAPPPFEVGAQGIVPTPCLYFATHGATICNDAPDVLHFNTPHAQHALDRTGYRLPRLHRLEERLTNQAPDPSAPLVLEAVPAIEAPWPAGTYAFAYTFVTNRGKQTGLSPPASITLDGTQEVKAHSPALPPPPVGGFWVDIDIYLLAPVPAGSGVYAGFCNDTGLASFATLFPPMSPGGDPPAANETGTLAVLLVAPDGAIDWQHDGTRFIVNQGSTAVLEAPLPALAATPPTLVGQDPTSGLPAFCPPPAPSPAQFLTQPVPPTALPDCAQARCGVAVAMEQHLESLYDQWAQWLGPLSGVGGALITVGFLTLTLDPFFDLAALAEAKVVWQVIRSTVVGLTGDEVNNMLATLSPAMITEIQRLIYCQLTCVDNVVTPTIAQIQAWEHGVYSDPTLGLNVLQNALLVALLQFTPLQDWQVVASTAQPSAACASWVCP